MKVTWVHYLFANDWPIKIWVAAFQMLFVGGTAAKTWSLLVMPARWFDPLIFFGCLLLMGLLGWFVSVLFGWPIMGPLYHDRSVKNGEPFEVGDSVQILHGPHRDSIVPVIAIVDIGTFAGGHRVRVDLGGPEEEDEVFHSKDILRVSPAVSKTDQSAET